MNRHILHVVTSPSFVEFTAAAFEEAAPGSNTFVGVDVATDQLRVPQTVRVEGVTSSSAGVKRLEALIAQSRIAVFHVVTPKIAGALASAPSSVLRVWSGWGGDYYGTTFDGSAGLLGPATRRLVNSARRPTHWAGRAVHTLRFGSALHAAARATDVFSAPVPEDLDVFRRRFPRFHGHYNQLNYVSVEDSLATGLDRAVGPDILVGNSAAPANNHLEVLELLARQDLSDRRVLVPLSYGDQRYAASIVSAGARLLGDRFVPITEFLPLDAYNELLADCGIVLMGSRRQMGLGNILRAIWQGAQLVLDRRNPIVGYLRERGVNVSLLDDVSAGGLPRKPLSTAQVAANRAFLDEYWGRATVIRNIKALIDLA